MRWRCVVSIQTDKSKLSNSKARPHFQEAPIHVARARLHGVVAFLVSSTPWLINEFASFSQRHPLSMCYFWSPEQLADLALWHFDLGFVEETLWKNLMAVARRRFEKGILNTPVPVYILADNRAYRADRSAFFPIAGVLPVFGEHSDTQQLVLEAMSAVPPFYESHPANLQ